MLDFSPTAAWAFFWRAPNANLLNRCNNGDKGQPAATGFNPVAMLELNKSIEEHGLFHLPICQKKVKWSLSPRSAGCIYSERHKGGKGYSPRRRGLGSETSCTLTSGELNPIEAFEAELGRKHKANGPQPGRKPPTPPETPRPSLDAGSGAGGNQTRYPDRGGEWKSKSLSQAGAQ